jgi:hypothetical protein
MKVNQSPSAGMSIKIQLAWANDNTIGAQLGCHPKFKYCVGWTRISRRFLRRYKRVFYILLKRLYILKNVNGEIMLAFGEDLVLFSEYYQYVDSQTVFLNAVIGGRSFGQTDDSDDATPSLNDGEGSGDLDLDYV